MSIAKRIAFGAVSSWLSRCTSILLGLLLMPVLFRNLPREALGVWLLLGQSWATLGILDLGLGATLTRRIAFAMGKSGADPGTILTQESLRDIADLVETGRRLFLILAIAAFLVSFGAGFFTLQSLHLSAIPLESAWIAWGILCLTQAFGVWASVWHCLLLGVGYVGWDSLLAAFTSCATLAAQIIVTLLGGGLIGLAIVAAIGALAQRFLILAVARHRRPELFSLRGSWQPALLKSVVPLALKAWVTSLSLVVVTNSDQFFIAGLQGATQIPAYRAAYVVFYNLFLLAITLATNSSVFIARLWQAGATPQVHRVVSNNLRLGLIIMVTGGGCVLGLGHRLFNLWIGHGNYIGITVAAVFFLSLLFEAHSYIISTCSRATEDEAFAVWAASGAALKIGLSLFLGARLGLLGIALGTLGAQLATNHWFTCYRGLRRLRMSLRYHLRHVLAPVSLVFAITLLAVRTLVTVTSAKSDWIVVGSGVLVAGCVLAGAVWLFILDHSQRRLATTFSARLLRATVE
jgi:O-antigen/teichoic acid export membrane protein